MAARSKARKRAVDLLYEADVRAADPRELLAERLAQADPPVPDELLEPMRPELEPDIVPEPVPDMLPELLVPLSPPRS